MLEQTPVTAIPESLPAADIISTQRTVYDATLGEIFARQFLAGASRALGGIVVYLIFLVLMGYLASVYILPSMLPFLTGMTASMELLQGAQQQQQHLLPLLQNGDTRGNSAIESGMSNTVPTTGDIERLYQMYQQVQPSTPPQF